MVIGDSPLMDASLCSWWGALLENRWAVVEGGAQTCYSHSIPDSVPQQKADAFGAVPLL